MAGKAAWIIQNVRQIRVYGVHSLLWHEVGKQFSSPLIEQMAHALGRRSALATADLRHMAADKKSIVDVVGLGVCPSITR